MELDFRRDPQVLSAVVDAMADGVFTVDARGRFVAWSAGAERITGFSPAEVIGRNSDLLEGPNCKGFDSVADLLAGHIPSLTINKECKVFSKSGRELYLHGNVRAIAEDGRIIGAVGTFTDLTSFTRGNEKIAFLESQIKERQGIGRLVGQSQAMQDVFRLIQLAAQTDVTTLVTGASGTGKELTARAIHSLSDRRDSPFLGLNCSAIPETLLESELFGHVKGAFTGAVRDKAGLFQAADRGTLFLDEIGDLSPLLQLKLLRVLREREVRRVGDELAQKIDVRLITATNRDLATLKDSGQLREDFYYRIRVFEIVMPLLHDRPEDVPLLVDQFVGELGHAHGKPVKGIARDALKRLMEYPWPGNVRELRNAIERSFVTLHGDTITLFDLPLEIRNWHSRQPRLFEEIELTPEQQSQKNQIREALKRAGGNRTRAAKLLGYSRVTLWKKMRRFGVVA